MGVLYRLTSASGKCYIGISSKGLEARWAKHVEHACGKRTAGALYAALRKYGPDTFTREVLAECADWDELRRMEIAAIAEHGTLAPNGYNITQGGEGTRMRLSVEARAKMSAAQKKRYERPDQREKLASYAAVARQRTSAAAAVRRAARRAARAAILASPEHKAAHSAATRAGMAHPDVKAKVVECAKARAASPEWRRKVGEAKRGVPLGPCTEDRKRKIAEARRREWADPVLRAKRLAAFALARAKAKEIAA